MLLPEELPNSLLTKDVQNYVYGRDWPKGLHIRLIDKHSYIQFVLFRDNFNTFSGEDRYQIAMMVKECMEKIRADGIPIYMEVAETKEGTNA
jgi:hypothetical protein